MPNTLAVVAPELALKSDLADIKAKILEFRAAPISIPVDDDYVQEFQRYLEGHWGRLYEALPEFFADLMTGKWNGSEQQSVPTSLTGDFGEYVGYRCFSATRKGATRVARVIRPSGYMRPDFVVLEEGPARLTALECKARAENAPRQLRRAKTSRRAVTLCGYVRDRRDDGLGQVGSDAVIRQRAPGDFVLVGSVADYGASRVVAHQSAIVTPLFCDGRLPGMLNGIATVPRGCSTTCAKCLFADDQQLVLAPVFMNAPEAIEPLLPVGLDVPEFFRLYDRAAQALWVRSEALFYDAFSGLADMLLHQQDVAERTGDYLVPLLDALGCGVEEGVAPNAAMMLTDLKKRLPHAQAGTVEAALSVHVQEAESVPRYEELLDGVVDERPRPRLPRDAVRSIAPVEGEAWQAVFHDRAQVPERERRPALSLEQLQDWTTARAELLSTSRRERVRTIKLPQGASVEAACEPSRERGGIELRLASADAEPVKVVADRLLSVYAAAAGETSLPAIVQVPGRRKTVLGSRGSGERLRVVFDDGGAATLHLLQRSPE